MTDRLGYQARTLKMAAAAGVLLGCSASETHVEIVATSSAGEPLMGLEITALPFDPDALLDSLGSVAATERPTFPDLEAELAAYRKPDLAALSDVGLAWRATWDSVKYLADSLRAVSPRSPGYRGAFDRLRQHYRRLTERAGERDNALRDQIGDDTRLALRASAAADTLRSWELNAYADFSTLADSAIARAGRQRRGGTTDPNGVLELHLETGPWWLIAERTHPENPFMQDYWSVAIVVSALGPSRAPLYAGNKTTRWRH